MEIAAGPVPSRPSLGCVGDPRGGWCILTHFMSSTSRAWYRARVVTRKTASLVRDAVVQAIDPIEIILFGSVAESSSGNDLDLLVVTGGP